MAVRKILHTEILSQLDGSFQLSRYNLNVKNFKRACFVLLILVLLLATSCGFVISGMDAVDIPEWAVGYWIDGFGSTVNIMDDDIVFLNHNDYSLSEMMYYDGWYVVEQYETDESWVIILDSFYSGDEIWCSLVSRGSNMLTMYIEGQGISYESLLVKDF